LSILIYLVFFKHENNILWHNHLIFWLLIIWWHVFTDECFYILLLVAVEQIVAIGFEFMDSRLTSFLGSSNFLSEYPFEIQIYLFKTKVQLLKNRPFRVIWIIFLWNTRNHLADHLCIAIHSLSTTVQEYTISYDLFRVRPPIVWLMIKLIAKVRSQIDK